MTSFGNHSRVSQALEDETPIHQTTNSSGKHHINRVAQQKQDEEALLEFIR
jgi:hypothetical protein